MSKTKEHSENFDLDPESFGGSDYDDFFPQYTDDRDPLQKLADELKKENPTRPNRTIKTGPKDIMGPLVTPEEESVIKAFYVANPQLKQKDPKEIRSVFEEGSMKFNADDAWIQTYSGRRFNPTNPVMEAIVIQDIAHSLSMQCRFSGHVRHFYSVAQHSVMVSYICNQDDALWGLMHDASEAYLVDVPRPLKRSGKFDAYLEFEDRMQRAVCRRFGLPEKEPANVKKADQILLATEARDLMGPLRSDWVQTCEPLPWKIVALPQQEAKNLFMKRFFELTGMPTGYQHYLSYENKS